MILTRYELDTVYQNWFRGCKDLESAKDRILAIFATEPDEFTQWTFQDIYEQSRKIIAKINTDAGECK